MKISVILAGLCGLLLAVGIVGYFGFGSVLAAVATIGWRGFIVFVLWAGVVFLPLAGAWFVLALRQPPRRFLNFMWGRQVREAAADVLPFSPIGGLVVGARVVTLGGVGAAQANASLAVDLVTEIAAQLVFMAFGMVFLAGRLTRATLAADPLLLVVFAGLALMLVGAVSFILAQRNGLGLMNRLISRVLPSAAEQIQGMHQAIIEIHAHRGRLALSTLLHAIAWFAAAFGSWIALRFMGVRISVGAVLAIESLVAAMKSAAFMIPNAAGVQEGGFAILGALFGLTPETAVALSLLKRARDLVLGVPTLLTWQAVESRRLFRRAPTAA